MERIMNADKYSRKDFLNLIGLTATSLAFSGWEFLDKEKYIAPIAIQLFTVRREIEKDFQGAMLNIADMGFQAVEAYALPTNITLAQAAIKGNKGFEQVPAGTGSMDIPSIVKAGGSNTKWMIVEFDEYAGNIFEGVQGSYTYLTKNGLAKGKV
jgi:hypothetical protein